MKAKFFILALTASCLVRCGQLGSGNVEINVTVPTPSAASIKACLASVEQVCPDICTTAGSTCSVASYSEQACNSCLATNKINEDACNAGVSASVIEAFQSQISCH